MEGRIFKNIKCKEQVFDVAFHPQYDLLAAGIIDGSVELWHHNDGSTDPTISPVKHKLNKKIHYHTSSCRGIEFTSSGDKLYSISADKSWNVIDVNGQLTSSNNNAHNAAINKLLILNENFIATGDDTGVVKLWDSRQNSTSAVMSWDAHTDFVADFDFCEETHTLVSVSGDATLCSYDIRNQKHFYRSDDQESELHCVRIIKDNKKVLCGSQDGVMVAFNWGQWGDCSDRFPGHLETVECMWKVDESTVITGSSDGIIRVVSIMPNNILGIIGDHKRFPVENIKPNRDKTILASIAHDEKIRLWDVSMLHDDGEVEDETGVVSEEDAVGCEGESVHYDEDSVIERSDLEVDEIGKASGESSVEIDSDDDNSSESGSAVRSITDEEEDYSEESDTDENHNYRKLDNISSSNSTKLQTQQNASPKISTDRKPTLDPLPKKKITVAGSDESDSDESADGRSNKRKKLPTAAEMFYADL